MAELLITAVSASHADPTKDRRGCWKRGYVVLVGPDGKAWGSDEGLPKFVLVKIPGVPADNALLRKYVQSQAPDNPAIDGPVYRRRQWQLRWADLPLAARNKLADAGELTIKAGAYSGPYDYTWAQIRAYFRDLKTGLDETGTP